MSFKITLLLAVHFSFIHDAEAGCGCTICTPCAPPPCPEPIPCPETICPMPPPCPIIIPKPCPVCVQPVETPVPVPVPRPVPEEVPEPVPVPVRVNTCCNTCSTPCGFGRKRRSVLLDNEIVMPINSTELESKFDPVCGNAELRKIMEKAMSTDLTASQLNIQKMVESELGGQYHALCARGELSYAAYTSDYCQHTKGGVTCYAFKALGTVMMNS